MLFVSILTSDRARDPELWATIWQGGGPPSLNLIGAYNLGNNKRVFIYEANSQADMQFVDRFNEVGVLETHPAFDRTRGWRAAFAGDLADFEASQVARGLPPNAVKRSVDLRRRGHEAANTRAARRAAKEWEREQEEG